MSILKIIKTAVLSLVTLAVISCSSDTSDTDTGDISKIRNLIQPAQNIWSGGQPNKNQFVTFAQMGVKHVVNLRPTAELDWNEREYVESLGINYYLIPVGSVDDISPANAKRLADILQRVGAEKTLVHCASGNRVGALKAFAAGTLDGKTTEEAIAHGKSWGMTSLEPEVRQKLLSR